MQANTYNSGLQQSTSVDNETLISNLLQHINASQDTPSENDLAADAYIRTARPKMHLKNQLSTSITMNVPF